MFRVSYQEKPVMSKYSGARSLRDEFMKHVHVFPFFPHQIKKKCYKVLNLPLHIHTLYAERYHREETDEPHNGMKNMLEPRVKKSS